MPSPMPSCITGAAKRQLIKYSCKSSILHPCQLAQPSWAVFLPCSSASAMGRLCAPPACVDCHGLCAHPLMPVGHTQVGVPGQEARPAPGLCGLQGGCPEVSRSPYACGPSPAASRCPESSCAGVRPGVCPASRLQPRDGRPMSWGAGVWVWMTGAARDSGG